MTGGWNLFRGKMSRSCMIRMMIVMIMMMHDGDGDDDNDGEYQ